MGEGEENRSAESFSSPSPNPTPSSSKTFVFIESLFGVFSGADCLWSMGTSKDTVQVKGCRFFGRGALHLKSFFSFGLNVPGKLTRGIR